MLEPAAVRVPRPVRVTPGRSRTSLALRDATCCGEEATLTVFDGQAAFGVVPRHGTTNLNRLRTKHEIRPTDGR
jgi:hypothetical protein